MVFFLSVGLFSDRMTVGHGARRAVFRPLCVNGPALFRRQIGKVCIFRRLLFAVTASNQRRAGNRRARVN
jgi:hypothetical protein